ncbi:DNA cytosine methyltransferase [Rhizobium lentis]|uniref:DNA cytosine methyltransferase n=1 Tax=Rhizobium lentis TaxID=1138194 RepID=UPI001C833091|nr:DNA cytosine methyltransferase [Rhizobium lentis]MBX5111988.1 DNA cytosine methyltransferase [Rhizobium lentis]
MGLRMRAFEVYSGVGGMGIGFEAAGIQVSGGIDAWDRVSHVRRANDMYYNLADATNISWLASEVVKYGINAIIGGPPCQDFSKGGKRQAGLNAKLTRSFALLVAAASTEWFVFENVPEAANSEEYLDAREIWTRSGYGLTELFLDASLYGVPQARERLIAIGRRGEAYQFLEEPILKAASPEQRSVRSILDPRDPDDARLLEIGYYFTRPFADGAGVRSIDEPAPGVNKSFRQPPYGRDKIRENPKDAIHATEAHELTQAQTARIQGFPRDFRWYPTDAKVGIGDVDRMIANAVPPAFAYHVAKAIRERHEGGIYKVNKTLRPHLKATTELKNDVIENICSAANRARRLLGGRTYPDIRIEVAMLDQIFDRMQVAWDENLKLPPEQRDPQLEKPFTVRQQSDLRAALRHQAAMPREKSKVEKAIEKAQKQREKDRKRKPPMFVRVRARWKPKWTVSDLLHSPVPPPGRRLHVKGKEVSLNSSKQSQRDRTDLEYVNPTLAEDIERDRPDLHPEDFNDAFLRSDDPPDET